MRERFHTAVESEANLLGVVFTDAGAMTSAPYRTAAAITGPSPARRSATANVSARARCTNATVTAPRATRPTR